MVAEPTLQGFKLQSPPPSPLICFVAALSTPAPLFWSPSLSVPRIKGTNSPAPLYLCRKLKEPTRPILLESLLTAALVSQIYDDTTCRRRPWLRSTPTPFVSKLRSNLLDLEQIRNVPFYLFVCYIDVCLCLLVCSVNVRLYPLQHWRHLHLCPPSAAINITQIQWVFLLQTQTRLLLSRFDKLCLDLCCIRGVSEVFCSHLLCGNFVSNEKVPYFSTYQHYFG